MSKIMRNCIILIAIVLIGSASFGQTNRSLINLGDKEIEQENFASAVYFYSQVINRLASRNDDYLYHPYGVSAFYKSDKKGGPNSFEPPTNPKSDELIALHKISDAYRLAKDYTNAEKWYAVAVENPSNEFPYVDYFYGYSLVKNGKYEEAKTYFDKVIAQFPEDNIYHQLAREKEGNCDFALRDEGTYSSAKVILLDSVINYGSTSFGMMYHQNRLLFASARKDTSLLEVTKKGPLLESDIYFTSFKGDGTYETPKWVEGINTEAIEGGATFSPDGKAVYFTRVNLLNHYESSIYVSRYFNGRWTEPFKLGKDLNLDGYKAMTPSMANDGVTLYYASNRPGTLGGMDIWSTTINDDGETTEPVNLGEFVNTKEDEFTPFYHSKSKTLYFSSEGHIGFGGFDVFKSTINPVTEWWSNAQNVGQPINSARDDAYFVWGKDMQTGYVTSDRDNCGDCDSSNTLNIHCNSIYRVERPQVLVSISGYVYDNDTDEPIPGATVTLKDVRGEMEAILLKADDNGFYSSKLEVNEEYFTKATKKKYFADAGIENTLGIVETINIEHDFFLTLIPTGEIEIKGIEYDFDAATLRPQSKVELDKLINFLNLNASLKIEIRSHTDERGLDMYNQKLSQRRAQSVVDYLVNSGISRARLEANGLGEAEPAVIRMENGKDVELTPKFIYSLTDKEKQEEYHQRNRRTAFKVLAQ
jgi:OmpA-OmpF porin, OOP family